MKEIKDTIKYLEHIDILSKTLSIEKKTHLKNIISVILTLLICLKKGSNLGKVKSSFEDKWI